MVGTSDDLKMSHLDVGLTALVRVTKNNSLHCDISKDLHVCQAQLKFQFCAVLEWWFVPTTKSVKRCCYFGL